MPRAKSKGKYNLLCVAHPDDETIFFGGLILRRLRERRPWKIVCVTSDGDLERHKQFLKACRALGVDDCEWWGFPDRYEKRLPVEQLVERLRELPAPAEIFTHGIVGEYGHPHHQDVSYAVHTAFRRHSKLYSTAYNAFPEFTVNLTPRDFALKARVLSKIYGSETSRFLNVLPATSSEGFQRLSPAEVEAVYGFLARGEPLRARQLKILRWLTDYLPRLRDLPRPF